MASSTFSGLAGNLGLDEQLLAGQALDGAADPLKCRVRLRAVEVRDALVVGVVDEVVEASPCRGRVGSWPLLLPVPKPRRLSLMPVLPSVDLVHGGAAG